MNHFTRFSVLFGIWLFLLIPGLEGHPAKDSYFTKIIVDIVAAMANGFLIIGLIDYAKQVHKKNKKELI